MPTFAENLKKLPKIDMLDRIELSAQDDTSVGTIENKTGQTGSLAVYYYLGEQFGMINALAAQRGLELYAEHTDDARANPGKHPNIDRLLQVIADNAILRMKVLRKNPVHGIDLN